VGLNPDPCKSKYLAKLGILPAAEAAPAKKKKKKKKQQQVEAEEVAERSGTLEEAKHREERPATDGQGSIQIARSPSLPAISRPATGISELSKSCRSSMYTSYTSTSVRTSKSVQDLVQKEVRKQLNRMSSHEHYLEQRLHCGNQFGTKCTADVQDLKEKIYFDVSHHGNGRAAYLDARSKIMPQDKFHEPDSCSHEIGWRCYAGPGKHIGKQLKPIPEKPSTICLGWPSV